MKKKLTKLEKSLRILSNAKISKWCYVNTDNEFNYSVFTFKISEKVDEYKVYNKAGTVYDYTNESYMEEVLVVVTLDGDLQFFNQNYDLIDKDLVRVKE